MRCCDTQRTDEMRYREIAPDIRVEKKGQMQRGTEDVILSKLKSEDYLSQSAPEKARLKSLFTFFLDEQC